MWVIIPVKCLQDSKQRLAGCLSRAQRATLSVMMLRDVLESLIASRPVQGVTVISSDRSLLSLTREYDVQCLLTPADEGYAQDSLKAIQSINDAGHDKVAIIPGDVPLLRNSDIARLDALHEEGIIVCPARLDGGTNALLSIIPLQIPLLFGVDSLKRHISKAAELGIPCQVAEIAGLERDIDTPADIAWLLGQDEDNFTIKYLKSLNKKFT